MRSGVLNLAILQVDSTLICLDVTSCITLSGDNTLGQTHYIPFISLMAGSNAATIVVAAPASLLLYVLAPVAALALGAYLATLSTNEEPAICLTKPVPIARGVPMAS